MSTERIERLRRCCDAYGADIARWPEADRRAFADLLDTEEALLIRAEAEALDGFLNTASRPPMAEDLTRRLVASYVPSAPKMRLADRLRAFLPRARLVPAGFFAGLGALGLVTGMATAQPSLSPEGEALAYIDAISVATLDEDGGIAWDAE